MKSAFKTIGINIFIFILLWLVLELLLHVLFVYVPHRKTQNLASYQQLLKHNNTPLYTPHRYLGYIPTPSVVKEKNMHNSAGFRGPEIQSPKVDSIFRIVCLGGSTTYTVKVKDYQKSYPYLMEKKLQQKGFNQVEVINSGAGGWSSWESLVNLQFRLLDLKPDLLVVYHGINDVHARVVWPPEAYKSDNSGRRIAKTNDIQTWWQFFCQKSNIIRVFLVSSGLQAPARTFRSFDDYPATFYMYELDQQFREDRYPEGIFKSVTLTKMLESNPPIYFKQNIESLTEIAKSKNIEIMLATFAYDGNNQDYITADPAYREALNEQNEILKKIGQEKIVSVFDFGKVFPQKKRIVCRCNSCK